MKFPIKACVNSGSCCLKSPCGFGEPVDGDSRCASLEFDEKGMSRCGKYEEIVRDPSSTFSPAFGAGCCMSMFNERRKEIIDTVYDGEEQYTGEYL